MPSERKLTKAQEERWLLSNIKPPGRTFVGSYDKEIGLRLRDAGLITIFMETPQYFGVARLTTAGRAALEGMDRG